MLAQTTIIKIILLTLGRKISNKNRWSEGRGNNYRKTKGGGGRKEKGKKKGRRKEELREIEGQGKN